MSFACKDIASLKAFLESKGLATYDYTEKHDVMDCPSVTVADPDDIPIRFLQC